MPGWLAALVCANSRPGYRKRYAPAAEQWMGLDYAYELIAERQSVDRLIRAVCEHLAPNDRTRVLGVLGSGLADVMDHVQRDRDVERHLYERGVKDICLSFLFAADEHLTEYAKEFPLAPVDGRVRVGCVWTSVECGSRFALVRATAATSAMSLLFEYSTNVRKTFSDIGQSGGALLVTFDDERQDLVSVWPCQGRFAPSGEPESFEDDKCKSKVDGYCADLLASAQRKLGGPPADAEA